MSATTISIQVPQVRTAPRLAARAGEFVAAAIGLFVQPRKPVSRYPAREAARVRALAHRYEAADPRFASELYAAADRHEMLYGD